VPGGPVPVVLLIDKSPSKSNEEDTPKLFPVVEPVILPMPLILLGFINSLLVNCIGTLKVAWPVVNSNSGVPPPLTCN
jgi:hypothetical protein